MKPKYRSRQHLGLIVLAFGTAVLWPTLAASAADFTWDGGDATDSNWGSPANWNPDGAPTPGSTNNLIFGGTTRLTSVNNYGDGNDFQNIIFDSTAGAFTISNNASNGIDWFGNINNDSANIQTIGFRLYQSASNAINATSGNVTLISSALLFRNGQALTLTAASGKTIQIDSVMADGGGGAGSAIAINGAGTVRLNGANTFTSGVNVTNGVLSISAANNVGTGGITLDGGTLRSTHAGTGLVTNAITVGASGGTINQVHTGNGTFRFDTANRLLGSGTLTITGNGSPALAGSTFSGVVVLNASNTYNGNVILQDGGTLEYNNAGGLASGATVTVNSNGVLSNAGVDMARAVTLNAGGSLAFQNNDNGVFSGPITVNGATTIRMQNWYDGTTRTGAITSTISGSGSITANAGTGAGGTLTLRGFDAKASSADLTINSTSLLVDSSAGTAAASVTRANSLTILDGNLTVNGVASQNTNDVFTTLNLNTGPRSAGVVGGGYSTWTLNSNAATSTALTFTNMGTRTAGSWVAINSAIGATPGAGTRNIFFTNGLSSPNLIGSGGALASGTASVIPWLHDTGGGAIYGYDATVGVAPITTVNVNPNSATAGQNINWNAAATLTADRTVNSLQMAFSGINLGGNTLTVASGVITADNASFSNGTLNFGTAEGQIQVHQARQLSINSAITGSGGATFYGFRTNSGNKGTVILSGANTYTGVTNMFGYGAGNNFVLFLTNSQALQNTTLNYVAGRASNISFGNGGTSGQTAYTFGGLTGNAGINLNNNNTVVGAVALTIGSAGSVDTASTVNTYSGVLSNTVAGGSIIKEGVATQVLSGTNTYSGTTTVNAGKLVVSGSIGSSAVSVNNSGTILASGKTGTIGSSVTINNGAILAAGDVNATGTATVVGATTFNEGSIFAWDLASTPSTTDRGNSYDALNTTGLAATTGAIFRVVLNGSQDFSASFWDTTRQWTDIFKNGGTSLDFATVFSGGVQYFNASGVVTGVTDTLGAFSMSGNTLTWSAVPEPTSALAGVLLGAGLLRRRRKI